MNKKVIFSILHVLFFVIVWVAVVMITSDLRVQGVRQFRGSWMIISLILFTLCINILFSYRRIFTMLKNRSRVKLDAAYLILTIVLLFISIYTLYFPYLPFDFSIGWIVTIRSSHYGLMGLFLAFWHCLLNIFTWSES